MINYAQIITPNKTTYWTRSSLIQHVSEWQYRSIVRLCHIGHGFLKFSLTLLNSERKLCGNVM